MEYKVSMSMIPTLRKVSRSCECSDVTFSLVKTFTAPRLETGKKATAFNFQAASVQCFSFIWYASIVLSNSAPVCFCGVLRLTDYCKLLFCN